MCIEKCKIQLLSLSLFRWFSFATVRALFFYSAIVVVGYCCYYKSMVVCTIYLFIQTLFWLEKGSRGKRERKKKCPKCNEHKSPNDRDKTHFSYDFSLACNSHILIHFSYLRLSTPSIHIHRCFSTVYMCVVWHFSCVNSMWMHSMCAIYQIWVARAMKEDLIYQCLHTKIGQIPDKHFR